MHSLHPLFHPTSVALVGASSDPERIGGRPLRFMLEGGFEAPLYPVNRSGDTIQGLPAYASVRDIPHPVDHAIICVPVAGVEAAVRDSIAKGVKAIQVLTAGFAEVDAEGRALQDRIVGLCRDAGVRMVGPNSLGLLNVPTRFFATFSTALNGLKPRPGPIALATQSGAFGSAAYGAASLRGLGFSKIVATGNEADVDVAECIDYLVDDPDTRVICAALESCRDGDRLRAALLKAAHAGKPVVIMKVGRTELGAAAASTHTGSLAGDDAVYDTVFAECGAWRAASIEEMLDIAYLHSTAGRLPQNTDVGVVTGSGGIGILMADDAGERGLQLSPLPAAARAAALELLPFAVASNPLDMTAQVTAVPQGVPRTVALMLDQADYGTVFAYLAHVGLSPQRFAATQAELIALKQRHPHRLLVLVMLSRPEVNAALEHHGIAVFEDPSRAVQAVAALAHVHQRRSTLHLPPHRPGLPHHWGTCPPKTAPNVRWRPRACPCCPSGSAAAPRRLPRRPPPWATPWWPRSSRPTSCTRPKWGRAAEPARRAGRGRRLCHTDAARAIGPARCPARWRVGGAHAEGRGGTDRRHPPGPDLRTHGDVRLGRHGRGAFQGRGFRVGTAHAAAGPGADGARALHTVAARLARRSAV